MTNVHEDNLTYADGSSVNGRVVISWPIFQVDGVSVAGGSQAWDIVDGVLDVNIYSNLNAQPIGVYYTAVYELDEGPIYTEYWIVPNIATANLGQVRVAFPQTPSVMISALQLTSAGASYGQFLGWNGSHWVPMYVSMINVTPNTIGLNLSNFAGPDLTVTGSPAVLGNALTLNVPDAAAAARGVVNAGAQSFAGAKTFLGNVTLAQELLFTQYAAPGVVWGQVWMSGPSTLSVAASVKLVAPDSSLPTFTAPLLATHHVDLTAGPVAPALPAGPVVLGNESILLPNPVSAAFVGVGVDANGNLWQSAGAASFAYLRPDAALVERWTDYSPYQHPTQAGVEVNRPQSTMVIYSDVSPQWAGIGFDQSMRIWVRLGPDGSGTYYYFGAAEALFPNLSVGNLTVTGTHNIGAALQVLHNSNLVATSNQLNFADNAGSGGIQFQVTGSGPVSVQGNIPNDSCTQRVQVSLTTQTIIGTRPTLHFVPGPNMTMNVSDDGANNEITINLDSTGGGPSNTVPIYAVNGAQIGQQIELNLIAGLGVNLTGLNNNGLNRVDVTIAATGGSGNASYYKDGTIVAAQPGLNFITGAGTTLAMVNNPGSNRVDVTVAATAVAAGVTSIFTPPRAGVVLAQTGDYNVSQVTGACPDTTTTKGDLIVRGASAVQRLGVSTDNFGLIADSSQALGMRWAAVVLDPTTAKGDMLARTVSALARVPVAATDGWVLTASSAQATGVAWAAPAATGVPTTRQVIAGVALSGGGSLAADVTLNVIPMAASGAGHSIGYVPDPGATAGATRYLREDATWGVPPGTAVGQTPWTSNINGATFWLQSAGRIGVGNDATVAPDPSTTAPHLIVGLTTPTSLIGEATVCANTATIGAQVGNFAFANYGIAATDKRIAAISALLDGATNSGAILLYTWNAGVAAERMRITSAGLVGIGTGSPSVTCELAAPSPAQPILGFYATGGVANSQRGALVWDGGANLSTGGWVFQRRTDAGAFNGNLVTILNSGLVGIGTIAPAAMCHVVSPSPGYKYILELTGTVAHQWGFAVSGNDGGFLLNDVTNAVTRMYIAPTTGYVGIGTTAPASALHVLCSESSANLAGIRQVTVTTTGVGGYGLYLGYGNPGIGANVGAVQALAGGVATNLLLQPSGGNVGIGTTAPTSLLTLSQGGSAIDYLRLLNSSSPGNNGWALRIRDMAEGDFGIRDLTANLYRLYINASGFVGINTAAPRSLLSLVPTTNATSAATATQLTIGENSNNPQYGLSVGYFYPGGNGAIQSLAANAGSTLYLNPQGGIVNVAQALNIGAGGASANGDLGVARTSSPTTGVIYFGTGGNYLYYDGTNFSLTNNILVNGYVSASTSLTVGTDAIVNGRVMGNASALSIPALYCPPFSSNPTGLPTNTVGFTVNQAGNYVTLWVKFNDGNLHIASFTLTTPSLASDKAQ